MQHDTQLAKEALPCGDIIEAIGGDGTVNEVGKALIHSDKALAIISVGSGNGLPRHLGIPVGVIHGSRALNHAHPAVIDTAKINENLFRNVAGVGFDALIAEEFAHFSKRGFLSYGQLALKEFPSYPPPQYYLQSMDHKLFVKKAFISAFANSSKYGNNFSICF